MNIKKSSLAIAMSAIIAIPTTASADIVSMTFNGLFTLTDGTGTVQLNADAPSDVADFGFRTNIAGSASIDTHSGAGTAAIDSFSFLGSGLSSFSNIIFQAIGDGQGGQGTLVGAQMGFNWGGSTNIPVTLIWDAAGFFAAISTGDTAWFVDSTSSANAISSTEDYVIQSPFGTFTGSLGAAPIAMTTFNTAGTTLSSIFPLTSDGISGSPMTTAPFLGFNVNLDLTEISAVTVVYSPVPVPAAVWLFGSGLMGLVGFVRRRNSTTMD